MAFQDSCQLEKSGHFQRILHRSAVLDRLRSPGSQLPSGRYLDKEDPAETQKIKAKWIQLEALIGSEARIKQIAQDIVTHFEQRQEVFEGKGMIVTMSRRIAADLYDEIIKIKPEWHSDDLRKGAIKVVMTSASSDGPKNRNIILQKIKEEL